MRLLLLVIVFINIIECIFSCFQAWNGGGTGAWYRVDTSCEYSFVSTDLNYCLPQIVNPSNADGFYVSLGIFNRFNGYSLDIGLTYDINKSKWFSYGNDRIGWKSGSISIDSQLNPCINVSLFFQKQSIHYVARTMNNSVVLGEDIYLSSQIDPFLNLTNDNINFGFYRFDSIAQTNETLKSGSRLLHAKLTNWMLQLYSGQYVTADEFYVASNVRGFKPGACCTKDEIQTITIYEENKWNRSDLSIQYD